jgi:hypothetical protein
MSRKDRSRAGRLEAIQALLDAGDHRLAREEARRSAADPGASAEERAGAAEAIAALRPEPGALVVGMFGLAAAVVLIAWTVVSGS